MKIFKILKVNFLFLSLSLSFSCRFQHKNQTVTEFLKEGANAVEIAGTVFNVPVQTDKDGYTCIPSTDDVSLYFLIKNPKGLSFSYNLAGPLDDEIITMQNDFAYYLLDAEKELLRYDALSFVHPYSKVEYSLGQQLLYRLEKGYRYDGTLIDTLGPGADFDPKLGLNVSSYTYNPQLSDFFTEEEYEAYYTDFLNAKGLTQAEVDADPLIQVPQNFTMNIVPYKSKIRLNTPPPYVQGACIMLDESTKTAFSSGNYVVCFNLPESLFIADGIHRDVKKLYVTGLSSLDARKFEEGVSLDIDFDAKTYSNEVLTLEKGSTENLKRLYENNQYYNDGMPAVKFSPSTYPVYIWDEGHSFSQNPDYTYTVTLEDEAGLKSSVVLNSRYLQLKKPTAVNAGKVYKEGAVYISFPVDEEGNTTVTYFLLNLLASTKTVGTAVKNINDVNVHYEIYSLNILRDPHNTGLLHTNVANYQEGQSLNSKALKLTDGGLYDIRAYAYKDGYLSSEIARWFITSGNYRYVDVEISNSFKYLADIVMDRWDEDLDEYNFKVYVVTDQEGNLVYEDKEIKALDGSVTVKKLPKVRYDDFSVNMAVKLYNYNDWYNSALSEKDRVKTYFTEEEALKYIKNLKMHIKTTDDNCLQLSYADNDSMKILKDFTNPLTSSPSQSLLQTYADSYALDMTEKTGELSLSLPEAVARAAAYAFEGGDHSYNIELYADVGDEGESVTFSSTNKINVRYIYVKE